MSHVPIGPEVEMLLGIVPNGPFNSVQIQKSKIYKVINVFYLVLVFVYFPNEIKNKPKASKIVTFNSYWGIPRRYPSDFKSYGMIQSSMFIPARALEVTSIERIMVHVRVP